MPPKRKARTCRVGSDPSQTSSPTPTLATAAAISQGGAAGSSSASTQAVKVESPDVSVAPVDYGAPAKKRRLGRKPGSQSFTLGDKRRAFAAIRQTQPHANADWEKVSEAYNAAARVDGRKDRSGEFLLRYYDALLKAGFSKPRDDPDLPWDIKEAREIQTEIEQALHAVTRNDGTGSEGQREERSEDELEQSESESDEDDVEEIETDEAEELEHDIDEEQIIVALFYVMLLWMRRR
ncbi:hypothetical protein FN846DRAFT_891500 [Sphaerosporella brunnea]|uniref:DUF6818 domain-containing protein n=1 Tax=Sphaerosporella brunnea TaxID=1250544 RepID=A0A5J5EU98_9PEZI|nr:hypothetical protein FN846DRAFT_891500 [Sphaerosporella brunnea]